MINPYLVMDVFEQERRRAEKRRVYPPKEEVRRRERVAVGRICRCGDCYCCEELRAAKEAKEAGRAVWDGVGWNPCAPDYR